MPIKGIDAAALPERFRYLVEHNPFAEHFELELLEYGKGNSLLRFPFKPEFTQHRGALQGGILVVYADVAMAIAMMGIVPPDRDVVTTDLHIQYLHPITTGPIYASGEIIEKGQTLIVATATITSSIGELCARCSGTFMLVAPREAGTAT